MPSRLGLRLAALSCLAWGCDSGPDTARCQDLQLSTGTFSASLSSGEMRPNCFSVSTFEGRTIFVAYEVGDFLAGDVTGPLSLTIDGDRPGRYTLDDNSREDDPDQSFAQVGATNSLEPSFAVSGSVTVDELSSTRMSGSFMFTTNTGLRVTGGRFSVDR